MHCCAKWEKHSSNLANKDAVKFCPYCGKEREPPTPLPRHMEVKAYVHGSKESMWELGNELGLGDEAMEKFIYALYEVEITLKVDTETGETEILSAK